MNKQSEKLAFAFLEYAFRNGFPQVSGDKELCLGVWERASLFS